MADLECFEKPKMLLSAKKWHPLILPLVLFLPEVPLELKTCQMIIKNQKTIIWLVSSLVHRTMLINELYHCMGNASQCTATSSIQTSI